jgi:mannose-6-phosphate isomerase-like protein (cupin superfamily)
VAVEAAPLRETKHGLCPDGEGWFVLNACASRWRDYGPMGFSCSFEGKRRFPELGINLNVLARGASLGLYHSENHQEDFLVLAGECVLVVEGETRPLKAWDFVHCPGGTAHMIVGTGDEPAVVLAVGARGGRTGLRYLVDPAARELGVSVEIETTKPAEAYASYPRPSRTKYRDGWLPDF